MTTAPTNRPTPSAPSRAGADSLDAAVRERWSLIRDEAHLYRRIVGARLRSDWQYRTAFFTYLVAQTVFIAMEIGALLFLVNLVDSFGGWTRAEVVFLYAAATLPFVIGDVFVSEVERLAAGYIRTGDFDVLMLRPSSPLLQVLALEFELRRLGKLLAPAVALVWSAAVIDVVWSPGRLAALAVAIASGTVIYGALWVIAGSIPFWMIDSKEATNALTYGSQFANQYPLHIYPGWIRAVMGWAMPLAFVAYVPTVFVTGAANPLGLPDWFAFAPPAVALILALTARVIWRTAVGHYQSTGS